MVDDVVLNKAAAIERCLARVREVHAGDDRNLYDDLTRQDSIVLNLQRACEGAIDLAMHLVAARRLGLPQESREAFDLLREAGIIDRELAERLQAMVGFRNVAVHDYQRLNLDIVRAIVASRLGDFAELTSSAIRSVGATGPQT
jgi:uncharacterized protein YutE (UPF0331/DUF86 family)